MSLSKENMEQIDGEGVIECDCDCIGVEEQIELSSLVENIKTKPLCKVPKKLLGETYSFAKEHNSNTYMTRHNEGWMPAYVEYVSYINRLKSFNSWPKQLNPKPEELCQAGFFYNGKSDTCYCFFCGRGLRNWDFQDDAFVEHKKWSPDCPYLRMICMF